MFFMSVTLEVLKFSGWLNAVGVACCRAERRAYDAGGIRAGRREGVVRRLCMQHTDDMQHTDEDGWKSGARHARNVLQTCSSWL